MKKLRNAIENYKEDRSLIRRRGRQTIRRATARFPKVCKIQEPAKKCQRRVDKLSNTIRTFVLIFRRIAAPSVTLRRLAPIALTLVALCAFAGDETGQPAPRFRARTTTGDQFNNASVKGKVVLFEFWTTWCQYCEAEAD